MHMRPQGKVLCRAMALKATALIINSTTVVLVLLGLGRPPLGLCAKRDPLPAPSSTTIFPSKAPINTIAMLDLQHARATTSLDSEAPATSGVRRKKVIKKIPPAKPYEVGTPTPPRARTYTTEGSGARTTPRQPPGSAPGFSVGWSKGTSLVDVAKATGHIVEPSDNALCSGGGYLMQGVNMAVTVFHTSNMSAAGPTVASAKFFGVGGKGAAASAFSDPRCWYDNGSKRWFLLYVYFSFQWQGTVVDVEPFSNYILAVSKTANPLGSYHVYNLTSDGKDLAYFPCHQAGCVADFPGLGIDKHGVWITTDMYPKGTDSASDSESQSAGSMLWGVSKAALMSGRPLKAWRWFLGAGFVGTQPAVVAAGAPYPDTPYGRGVQYIMGRQRAYNKAFKLVGLLQLWAVVNTSALDSNQPPTLVEASAHVGAYGGSNQEIMLAQRCTNATVRIPARVGCPLVMGDRPVTIPGPIVWAANALWAVAADAVRDRYQAAHYYLVRPSVSREGELAMRVLKEGVWAPGKPPGSKTPVSVLSPQIMADAAGNGVIIGNLVGSDTVITPVMTTLTLKAPPAVSLYWPKARDGLVGSYIYENAIVRQGDYSAATMDEAGRFYVSTQVANSVVPQTGKDTSSAANWGTLIGKVALIWQTNLPPPSGPAVDLIKPAPRPPPKRF